MYALIAQQDVWNAMTWMFVQSAKRMHILMLEISASVTTVISWIWIQTHACSAVKPAPRALVLKNVWLAQKSSILEIQFVSHAKAMNTLTVIHVKTVESPANSVTLAQINAYHALMPLFYNQMERASARMNSIQTKWVQNVWVAMTVAQHAQKQYLALVARKVMSKRTQSALTVPMMSISMVIVVLPVAITA